MPGYPWLALAKLDPQSIVPKMRAMQRLNVPYTEQDIKDAPAQLAEKTEQDALVAYLQGLGTQIKSRN
jgi:cytochrome c oxidase cbb3-type subunit 2